MAPHLRLGLAQMTSLDNLQENVRQVELLFLQAARDQADLVVFPENTLHLRIRSGEPVRGVRCDGPEFQALQKLVDAEKISMMITTAHEHKGADKLVASTFLFSPGRGVENLYSKIHMFDVDVPGAPSVRESSHYLAGSNPRLLKFKEWNIGLSICFDVRFAGLFQRYTQQADLILVPSSFLVPTGEAHWHVLLRARAIENQCYVAAPAQSGEHRSGDQSRWTYGHSLVVDPWGRVLCDLEKSPEVRVIELGQEEISKVRRQIPMNAKL